MTAAKSRQIPAMTGTELHVWIPFAGEWLTANRSSRYRHGASDWRHATMLACRAAKLPLGITPVSLHLVFRYVGRRPPVRDRMNLYPTVKAIVDGLTPLRHSTRAGKPHTRGGYGLIPDDSDRHVAEIKWSLGPTSTGQPGVDLCVTHTPPALSLTATAQPTTKGPAK